MDTVENCEPTINKVLANTLELIRESVFNVATGGDATITREGYFNMMGRIEDNLNYTLQKLDD